MLELLKKEVWEANLFLRDSGLVCLTWGNASALDRETGLVVIKPSGVPYEKMTAEDMVVVDREGQVVEGQWRPSSDTPTHLELYRCFPQIGGVIHTHSTYATAFAQAHRAIPALGTTHADHFWGDIPCTEEMTEEEIAGAYEQNTGKVIVRTLEGKDPLQIPAALVAAHGVFTWGTSVTEAAENALVTEKTAEMAYLSLTLAPPQPIAQALLDRHFFRKHGEGAYYGQSK